MLEEAAGIPVVAMDLVGWGFSDLTPWWRQPRLPLGADLKREHLEAFRYGQMFQVCAFRSWSNGGKCIFRFWLKREGALELDCFSYIM
jgi:hypothetical protein